MGVTGKNETQLPGSLVVRIRGFHHCGQGSVPGLEIDPTSKLLHTVEKINKKEKKKKKI